MKIFYAVQATGNGHISRAIQLLPYLKRFGNVDIFLSGSNSQLSLDIPVKYRNAGLSLFYNNTGGLDYRKMMSEINPVRLWDAVKELPVQNYDVVINDFECITSLACAYKKIKSVNFGHQASFQSPLVPRPVSRNRVGEFILKHYARATQYVGFHFERYDDFIFEPVIKKDILLAKSRNKNHITVYLSSYRDEVVAKYFKQLKGFQFHIFSKEVQQARIEDNLTFIPLSDKAFSESMISSCGVITGAGFETPAEALHLGKKLMVIPIQGQYEQCCNAAALQKMGVTVLSKIDQHFVTAFHQWMQAPKSRQVSYENVAPKAINFLLENYPYKGISLDLLYPNLVFN